MNFRKFIFESKRKDIMVNISEQGYQVFLHLIKLLYYKDPINIIHHISDINNWLDAINLLQRNEKFKPGILKELLMGEYKCEGLRGQKKLIPYDTNYLIQEHLKNYHSLEAVRTVSELNDVLSLVYDKIVLNLSNHQNVNIDKIVQPYIET